MPRPGIVGPSLLAVAVMVAVTGPGLVAAWMAGGAVVGVWALVYDRCVCAGEAPEGRVLAAAAMTGACIGPLVALGQRWVGQPMWWLLGTAAVIWIALATLDGTDTGGRRRHLRQLANQLRHWPPMP